MKALFFLNVISTVLQILSLTLAQQVQDWRARAAAAAIPVGPFGVLGLLTSQAQTLHQEPFVPLPITT